MDEKFLDLRGKLDMTRDNLTKEIKKAKKESQQLRIKFSLLTGGKECLDKIKLNMNTLSSPLITSNSTGISDSPNPSSYFDNTLGNDAPNSKLKQCASTGELKNKNFVQQFRVTIADSASSSASPNKNNKQRPYSAFPSPSKSAPSPSASSSMKNRPQSAFKDVESMTMYEKEKLLHQVITKINQKDEKVRAASRSGWTADRLYNLLG